MIPIITAAIFKGIAHEHAHFMNATNSLSRLDARPSLGD
jgi:hypothetical protein